MRSASATSTEIFILIALKLQILGPKNLWSGGTFDRPPPPPRFERSRDK